jgi:hypothetical protein
MLKNKMQPIDESAPLVDPFPISEPTPEQMRRYKTFYEENKHSFDDGMSRNIDRDSGVDLAKYKMYKKIYKIIGIVVVVVAVIIVLVCIL